VAISRSIANDSACRGAVHAPLHDVGTRRSPTVRTDANSRPEAGHASCPALKTHWPVSGKRDRTAAPRTTYPTAGRIDGGANNTRKSGVPVLALYPNGDGAAVVGLTRVADSTGLPKAARPHTNRENIFCC